MKWRPDRLKAVRLAKGLSHEKLAKLVGVTRTTVLMWEKEKEEGGSAPIGGNALRLAQALGKPLEYFYDEEPEAPGLQEPMAAAAMPEPTTPDWNPPAQPKPNHVEANQSADDALNDLRRRIEEQERRIREIERKLQERKEDSGKGG